MDVSIICPIHGHGEFLHQTLDSIKAQSFGGDMEVILILDRCSGDVLTIINNFQNLLDIKAITSTIPGLVPALNLGLKYAGGKYVARIDSDDLMVPSRIEKQFAFLETEQQIIVLGSSVVEINEHGNKIGLREYPVDADEMNISLSKQCTIAHPSVMFRRDNIIKLGGYRSFFENAEDYDLWLRVRDHGLILSTLEPLTFYRIHSGQISTLQLKQRVFGSYSARINNFLEKRKKRNLISRYGTFEKWNNSLLGGFILKYVSFRLMISESMEKFENGGLEGRWLEKLLIGKVLIPIKNWKKRRKT
jgi:glycosyltransferase involved in cell wall biosynthesis